MPSLDYFALTDPGGANPVELANDHRFTTYLRNGYAPSTFVNIEDAGCRTAPVEWDERSVDNTWNETGIDASTLLAEAGGFTFVPIDGGASDLTIAGGVTVVTGPIVAGQQQAVMWDLPSVPAYTGAKLRAVRVNGVSATGFPVNSSVAFTLGSAADVPPLNGLVYATGIGGDAWEQNPGFPWALAVPTSPPAGPADITLVLNEPIDAAGLAAGSTVLAMSLAAYDNPATLLTTVTFDSVTLIWEGYGTPETDLAPWYDPSVPQSKLFAGASVVSVEGLDVAPVERTVTRLNSGGAQLGPLVPTERNITFVMELTGSSCCAVAYGLSWLNQMLTRRCSADDGCQGADLVYLSCCPDTYAAPLCSGGTVSETAQSPWRVIPDVGLLETPVITDRRGRGCGSCGCNPTVEVEFTLVAGNPRVFLPETELISTTELVSNDSAGDPIVDGCLDLIWKCDPAPDCETALPIYDPACGAIPPPPIPQSSGACMCDPLVVHRYTSTLTLDVPDALTAVLSVQVTAAGDTPVRNLSFRLFDPTPDYPCEASDDPYPPCDLAASLGISYIPAGATLTVDGVRRRALLELADGRVVNASRFIYAASGSPYQWLDLACGASYCMTVEADALNTNVGDTFSVTASLQEL